VAQVPAGADEVYLAFSFPYQLADWERFAAAHRGHPDVRLSELARTSQGRSAPLMTIGEPERAGRNVLFCCRHHACEAVASYMLEGVVEAILAPAGAALRRSTAFSIVPMVDLDGAEDGDQGKARRPHDHNRDYTAEPLYPTVRAVQGVIRRLAGQNLAMYVDCHCPWMRSGRNEAVFLVEPPAPLAAEAARFREILRRVPTGPVRYSGGQDIPCGVDWNTGTEPTSQKFVRENGGPGLRVEFGVEFSYSVTEGALATPDGAREFGRGFARAVGEYLG
jgi:hypothetical protein